MALAFTQVCGGEESGDSREYTWGEFGGYGWVMSDNVTSFYRSFLVRVVSASVRSVGSI